jgi:hypothetical protein
MKRGQVKHRGALGASSSDATYRVAVAYRTL